MSSVGKYPDRDIKVIARTMESYTSFSWGQIRFLDSYQFLAASLESLTENLAAEGFVHFKQFRKHFQDEDIARLLLQKGEYPYEYVTDSEVFKETSLPPIEKFYSSLSKQTISQERYEHAQNVWKQLEMKTFLDYHCTYQTCDILLLSDIVTRFREVTISNFGLDPLHYLTAAGLAWDAALKMSGVNLDLLTDPDHVLFFESGVRGGVAMISSKYSKSNAPDITPEYDESKPNKFITLFDINNLYGFCMMSPNQDEINTFDITSIPEDGEEGYVLECDLSYPEELHDEHNCYPLCPENILIEDEDLSPHSQQLYKKLNARRHKRFKSREIIPKRIKSKKLVPNLRSKKNYVIHYRHLQLCLKLGMKVERIHRIMNFKQKPWLKTYIEYNSIKRRNAKNDFERALHKFYNNSVFGKFKFTVIPS